MRKFGKGSTLLAVGGLAALLAFGPVAPAATVFADEATVEGVAAEQETGGQEATVLAAGLEGDQEGLASDKVAAAGDEAAPAGDKATEQGDASDVEPTAGSPAEDPEAELGVVVTDKNATIEIPVYGQQLEEWPYVLATGTLNGSAVPEGAHVYLQCVEVGDIVDGNYIGGDSLTLIVNGQKVTEGFGTLNLTLPFPKYWGGNELVPDGKLHDIVITTYGWGYPNTALDQKIVPMRWTEDATVTVTATDLDCFFSVEIGNLAHVDTENITVAGDTGIKASGKLEGANIPEGATVELAATELKAGDPAYDKLVDAMGDGLITGVYDISMFVDGKQIHDGFGELTVSIPVDAKYNGHWVYFWHLHEDGTITTDRTIVKDGYMTIAVSDLSAVALEIGELAEDESDKPSTEKPGKDEADKPAKDDVDVPEGELPQTGDPAIIMGAVAASGALLASAGVLSKKRR